MFVQQAFCFGEVKLHILELEAFQEEAYVHVLTDIEKKRLSDFVLPKRKKEFIAVRYLKEQLFPGRAICYNALGAPYLEGGPFISISHTTSCVGIAYCTSFPVGFDLEEIRDKVQRIKDKFLHAEEIRLLDTSHTETLIKLWSGKEALYKLFGMENIIFAEQLRIVAQNTAWEGHIYHNKESFSVKMNIFTRKDCVIAINTSDVQKTN